jgi:hypothetical protein
MSKSSPTNSPSAFFETKGGNTGTDPMTTLRPLSVNAANTKAIRRAREARQAETINFWEAG